MFDITRPIPTLGQVKVMGSFWSWLGLESDTTEIAASCYTCVNGSDVQYGIPSDQASGLRDQGWDCRRDECASQNQAYAQPYGQQGWTSDMSGRIRLAPGLGRRALG